MTGIFPLSAAYLPGDRVVLNVFEERYLRLLADLEETGERTFVTVLIERGQEVGGGDRRFERGVTVHIESVLPAAGHVVVTGTAGPPVCVTRWDVDNPYPTGTVESCGWQPAARDTCRDAGSAVSLLAQSVRSLLARHTVVDPESRHPVAGTLAMVASGQWQGTDPSQDEVERAFWIVARCVPCGPLDRHRLLCETTCQGAVRLLRSIIEHTDEILSFGTRDER